MEIFIKIIEILIEIFSEMCSQIFIEILSEVIEIFIEIHMAIFLKRLTEIFSHHEKRKIEPATQSGNKRRVQRKNIVKSLVFSGLFFFGHF